MITYHIVTEVPTEALVNLYKSGGWWHSSAVEREHLPAIVKNSFCFVIAKDGEEIIGMGRAISDGVSDAYIQDVVVLYQYRKQQIGSEIIKMIVNNCALKKMKWIGLIADPDTQNFYERLGFSPLTYCVPMVFKNYL